MKKLHTQPITKDIPCQASQDTGDIAYNDNAFPSKREANTLTNSVPSVAPAGKVCRTTEKSLVPTVQQYTAFQAAFNYFNLTFFGNALSPCILTFNRDYSSLGAFRSRCWRNENAITHEISLNPENLPDSIEVIMGVLVHEMTHLWQTQFGRPSSGGYHNREFANKLFSVGLIPSTTGEPGGKRTGYSMSHYMMDEGVFEQALEDMPEEIQFPWLAVYRGIPRHPRPDSIRKRKTKYSCSGCGNNVWGKPELHIICGDCHLPYIQMTGNSFDDSTMQNQ